MPWQRIAASVCRPAFGLAFFLEFSSPFQHFRGTVTPVRYSREKEMKRILLLLLLPSIFGAAQTHRKVVAKAKTTQRQPLQISQYMREVGLMYFEQVKEAKDLMLEAMGDHTRANADLSNPDNELFAKGNREKETAHERLKSLTSLERRIELTLTDRSRQNSPGDQRFFEILKVLRMSADLYDRDGADESILPVEVMCESSVENSIHDGELWDPSPEDMAAHGLPATCSYASLNASWAKLLLGPSKAVPTKPAYQDVEPGKDGISSKCNIFVYPDGAEVFVDDVKVGVSPVSSKPPSCLIRTWLLLPR
jgi:hypothetical protein